MTDLEKIDAIIKESFGAKFELNNTEKQGLLSSEQVLTIMFGKDGEIEFAIVEGADGENDDNNKPFWWNADECIEDCVKCPHRQECTYSEQSYVF